MGTKVDFKTLLTSENRCVLFECTYEPTTAKWSKFPRNGNTRKPYHNDSDLNSYAVCEDSARRYFRGLVGVRTGQLSNGLHLSVSTLIASVTRTPENGPTV